MVKTADQILANVCAIQHIDCASILLPTRGNRHKQHTSKPMLVSSLMDNGFKYDQISAVLGYTKSHGTVGHFMRMHRTLMRRDKEYKSKYLQLKQSKNETLMTLRKILELNHACKRMGLRPIAFSDTVAVNLVHFRPAVGYYEEERKKMIDKYALHDTKGAVVKHEYNGSMLVDFGDNMATVDKLTEDLLNQEFNVDVMIASKESVTRALAADQLAANDLSVLLGSIIPFEHIEQKVSA